MGDVRKHFLDILGRHFQLPTSSENQETEWRLDYVNELSFYSDTVLEFAAKKLVANAENRFYPIVSACIKACRETHAEFGKPDPASSAEVIPISYMASKYREISAQLGIGESRDFLMAFGRFCRKYRRVPFIDEARDLLRSRGDAGRDAFSTARVAAADGMLVSDLGLEAADGDWIIGLWDFCRENQRYPSRAEVERIKAAQAIINADFREWSGGPLGAMIQARQGRMDNMKQTARGTA